MQASALTATELTNSPNQYFGVRKNVENGGIWGEMVGNGESSTKQYAKCRNNFKSGRKIGENGTKYPFLTVPFSPFFCRPKIFPTILFVKMNSPQSPTKKWEFLPSTNTPPRRLVRRLGTGTAVRSHPQCCTLTRPIQMTSINNSRSHKRHGTGLTYLALALKEFADPQTSVPSHALHDDALRAEGAVRYIVSPKHIHRQQQLQDVELQSHGNDAGLSTRQALQRRQEAPSIPKRRQWQKHWRYGRSRGAQRPAPQCFTLGGPL